MNTLFHALRILLIGSSLPLSFAGPKMATYNVGLAPTYVPMAQERRPYLAEAIARSRADVLCLQEVWGEEDRRAISEAVKTSHPHQYTTPVKNIRSQKRPACLPWDLFGKGKFVSCMRKNCGKLEGDAFTSCIIKTCGPALQRLKEQNRECATSLMAQVGKSSLHALLTVLNVFAKPSIFAYGGSNGLMLVSKYPLKDKSLFDMSSLSTLNNRAALFATVDTEEEQYQVICTHLTANLSSVPYTGTLSGWNEENKTQALRLVQKALTSPLPTVLMGDFNCGLKNPAFSIEPQLEHSCGLILKAGFTNHLEKNNPACTFCAGSENHLNKGKSKSYLIDHIYVRGATVVSSAVIFKEEISITTKDKQKHVTNLSDHFGVIAELE